MPDLANIYQQAIDPDQKLANQFKIIEEIEQLQQTFIGRHENWLNNPHTQHLLGLLRKDVEQLDKEIRDITLSAVVGDLPAKDKKLLKKYLLEDIIRRLTEGK
jgi:hypothetical protein